MKIKGKQPRKQSTNASFGQKIIQCASDIVHKQKPYIEDTYSVLELLTFLSETKTPFVGGTTTIIDEEKVLGSVWLVGEKEAFEQESKSNTFNQKIAELAINYREAEQKESKYLSEIRKELDSIILQSFEFDTNVYFIYNPGAHAIKIGKSKDVKKRLTSLETASPGKLKLLYSCPARNSWEKIIHDELGKYRMKGEWFEASKELFRFIMWFKVIQETGLNSRDFSRKSFNDEEYYNESLKKLLKDN